MKKTFFVVILIFFINTIVLNAENLDIVETANNWLMSKNLIARPYFENVNDYGKELSKSYTGTRKTIVYGTAHGDFSKDEYRYLGYTMSDANFTNYMYPDDTSGKSAYYNRGYNKENLVKEPWYNKKTRKHFAVTDSKGLSADNRFCGKAEFEQYIKEGLRIRSRDEMSRQGIRVDYPTIDFTAEQIESINWYEYTYIIQPPTDYSWGSGVLFRNNGAGYLTIPIPPNRYGEVPPEPTPTEEEIGVFLNEFNDHFYYEHIGKGRATFRIYKFANADKVISDYTKKPNGAELVEEVQHIFSNGNFVYSLVGENPYTAGGGKDYNTGYYITSSETDFRKGVLIRWCCKEGSVGVDFHKGYYPKTGKYDNVNVSSFFQGLMFTEDNYGYFRY